MTAATHRAIRPPFRKAYSFALITAALFLLSWVGQFVMQMIEVANDAEEHGAVFTWAEFLPQFFSSTFENWQSEFLQLVWQAMGLALLYHWGSSQSREGGDRVEAKLDALLADRGIDATAIDLEIARRAGAPTGRPEGIPAEQ
ncbi:hypothetical protein UO65_1393 [Actinokineospora spheciospongiae]|uniref:Uncharacterized protein n=1 Tax=Actinokineospora spheciospongiae TaxID=909613 RepID=W7JAV7_9PSEU|nr:DUF6766 family protein [Actinokineospora spheciospongiae]EWC63179.1 hypothetical protein UO65_1393 [Actinokineospora spheciospongiae]PWW66989.1 hypothetical protein DFQ13_101507 [Actinokineospora spheciospongiae]